MQEWEGCAHTTSFQLTGRQLQFVPLVGGAAMTSQNQKTKNCSSLNVMLQSNDGLPQSHFFGI